MKKLILLLILMSFAFRGFSNDSLKIESLERKISELSENVQEVKRDQNNYSIEKNLLKETFSNNYDRIQIFLTALFGLFGIIAYLGIKDINSIKKEYREELEKLLSLKSDFEAKSKSFDIDKTKFESEIKEILKQSELQNKKIKSIELKEKVTQLIKEDSYSTALDFVNIIIDIIPDDINTLRNKAVILTRLNRIEEAKSVLKKAIEHDNANISLLSDYAECLMFAGNIEEVNRLIAEFPAIISKEGLEKYFLILKSYQQTNNVEELKRQIIEILKPTENDEKSFFIMNWNFIDAKYFAAYEKDKGNKSFVLGNTILFLNAEITGKEFLARLSRL